MLKSIVNRLDKRHSMVWQSIGFLRALDKCTLMQEDRKCNEAEDLAYPAEATQTSVSWIQNHDVKHTHRSNQKQSDQRLGAKAIWNPYSPSPFVSSWIGSNQPSFPAIALVR